MTSVSPFSGPLGREAPLPCRAQKLSGKRGLEAQARGWSTKPAAQTRTEPGLAAGAGGTSADRPAPPLTAHPPAEAAQSSSGPQPPPSQSHTHTMMQTAAHTRTRAHKAMGAQGCRHLLRNAHVVTRLTHLCSRPRTSYAHGRPDGQLQTCPPHTRPRSAQTHYTHIQPQLRRLARTGSYSRDSEEKPGIW